MLCSLLLLAAFILTNFYLSNFCLLSTTLTKLKRTSNCFQIQMQYSYVNFVFENVSTANSIAAARSHKFRQVRCFSLWCRFDAFGRCLMIDAYFLKLPKSVETHFQKANSSIIIQSKQTAGNVELSLKRHSAKKLEQY